MASLTAQLFGGATALPAAQPKPAKAKDTAKEGQAVDASAGKTRRKRQRDDSVAATQDLFARKQDRPDVNVEKLFSVAPEARRESRREKQRREDAEAAEKGEPAAEKEEPQSWKKKHKVHARDDHADEDKRTVFVGNLPNTVSRKAVEKHFKSCGPIESVRIRAQVLRALTSGEKERGRAVRVLRGEIDDQASHVSAAAYVLFKNEQSVAKALDLTATVVNSRHISVTREGVLAKAYEPKTSVFLGNLAYDVSDEQVWQFMFSHGLADVRRVTIPRDRTTGSAHGFGYVEFASPESVQNAIAIRGETEIAGRPLRVAHVQRSKQAAQAMEKTKGAVRRERRRQEGLEKHNEDVERQKGPQRKKQRTEKKPAGGKPQNSDSDDKTPAWMGMVTNPRKKIDRDLRVLLETAQDRKKRILAARRKPTALKGETQSAPEV